ncbi:Cache sensor-containing two-component system histidine kinase [Malaciobacter marinus]|uniref:histidine kinase n=1 Tax=Malaciobacter marinus TaxID=505249 RepID=A0A347TM29_9BACT|nr:cache domain-containing protein [Malaciobacter marinus]AXX87657.1 Cache sensor-containing two-component system histidine kinase [Malaciobacter marinus]PHO15125.1 ATP-binding protein [Malaciobacter marinus]
MQLITEKNISKMIIYVFIIIMSSMIFMISYFYVKNTNKNFELQMDKYVNEYYNNQKAILKKQVETVIDILNYNITQEHKTKESIQKEAIRLLNNISFQEKRSDYFFVYEIENMNGGDGFAKMIVNPNRPDLLGKLISTKYEDADGKKFREEFMRSIRKKGDSFNQYAYKKPKSNEIKQKVSYFKLYKHWNWVISIGVYTDDIEKEIALKRKDLKQRVKTQVVQNILVFLLFLTIAIVLSILVSEKIDDVLQNYQNKVKAKSKELMQLNQNLEKKVKEEVSKNREHEQLLVQKSRFIALGEMISNIAHQWRQPLSELSSILMFIKFKYSMNGLDEQIMQQKSQEAEKVIDYMSHTIDDFRNFFMPKKDKETFLLNSAVESVITILSSALSSNKIKITINIDENLKVNTYLNEFEQVVLNLLSNAKDILILNKINKPNIKIFARENENDISLFIHDNGKGIAVEPIEKIFEPYFTTKSDSDGTGIGLYMSKIIVEKNIKGKLRVQNVNDGARFEIVIPKK